MKISHRGKPVYAYKSIGIHAAPGVHEDAFDLLVKRIPQASSVLDIAAGSGAFTARLVDSGYHVTSNERDLSDWRIDGIQPMSMDLNTCHNEITTHFSEAPSFDAIAAIEVIEHLASPSGFLKLCWDLLKDNGFLIITTPNPSTTISRLKFLRSGDFIHFSPVTAYETGHVTPLPAWLLRVHAEQSGFTVDYIGPAGKSDSPDRFSAYGILAALVHPFCKENFAGERSSVCYAMVFRKGRENLKTSIA
jgi:SAM-dependent methyltransferase